MLPKPYLYLRLLPCVLLACGLPLGAQAAPTLADDVDSLSKLNIEQLEAIRVEPVQSASRYLQLPSQASASVSTVSRDQIRTYGYRTLAEILDSVAGFYSTSDRNYSYIGTRGLNRPGDFSSRILLMVDGHRLNDNLYDAASVDETFVLDVDLIERVEIVRGPRSALYGTNALLAIVNVVTRAPESFKSGEGKLGAGHFDHYRGRATFAAHLDSERALLLSASAAKRHGQTFYFEEFDSPSSNNGLASNVDAEKRGSFLLDFRSGALQVQFAYNARKKSVPTASFDSLFNDSGNSTLDERSYLDLSWTHALSLTSSISARSYYDWTRYKGSYVYPPFAPEPDLSRVPNVDYALGQGVGGEISLLSREFRAQTIVLGVSAQWDLSQKQSNYDSDPYFLYLDSSRSETEWALYAQDDIQLTDAVTLSLGGRFDYFDSFGAFSSPRVGLVYAGETAPTVKLLYGRAFRAPNAYERFYRIPAESESVGRIEPEEINSYEVVFEHSIRPGLQVAINTYLTHAQQLIEQHYDPLFGAATYENSGHIDSRGMEFSVRSALGAAVHSQLSYSLQKSEDDSDHAVPSNSPEHLCKLDLDFPVLGEDLTAAVSLRTRSHVYNSRNTIVDSFITANLILSMRQALPNTDLRLAIYNLFDQQYAYPASQEHRQQQLSEDGRNAFFEMTYGF